MLGGDICRKQRDWAVYSLCRRHLRCKQRRAAVHRLFRGLPGIHRRPELFAMLGGDICRKQRDWAVYSLCRRHLRCKQRRAAVHRLLSGLLCGRGRECCLHGMPRRPLLGAQHVCGVCRGRVFGDYGGSELDHVCPLPRRQLRGSHRADCLYVVPRRHARSELRSHRIDGVHGMHYGPVRRRGRRRIVSVVCRRQVQQQCRRY
jgi:hypothetical protein